VILGLFRVLIGAPKLSKAQAKNGHSREKLAERGPQSHSLENCGIVDEVAGQHDQAQRLGTDGERVEIWKVLEGRP